MGLAGVSRVLRLVAIVGEFWWYWVDSIGIRHPSGSHWRGFESVFRPTCAVPLLEGLVSAQARIRLRGIHQDPPQGSRVTRAW